MGRFINADGYASTGQGLLGNNMFAYCNNNPANNIDALGNMMVDAMRTYDGCMMDGGSASCVYSQTSISGGTNISIPSSFSLVRETEQVTNGTKIGRFISGEFSGYSFGDGGLNLFSFDASILSLDLITESAELSLFDLGNASASMGIEGVFPYASVMVSLWSPSVTFEALNKTVSLSLHFGAIGKGLKFTPNEWSASWAQGIGFSFSVS